MDRRDGVVGDDRHAPLRDRARDEVRPREQAAPDVDRVAAALERYADSLHVVGQALQQLLDQRADALAPGVDDQVGDLAVERVAHALQLLELRERIVGGEQRPRLVVPGALVEVARLRPQIDHEAARREQRAVLGLQHDPAAGPEHDVLQGGEAVDHLRLARAEARLAFDLEDDLHANAGAPLDLVVGVVEGLPEPARELARDRRLAGAHEPDQEDVAAVLHGVILSGPPGSRGDRAGTCERAVKQAARGCGARGRSSAPDQAKGRAAPGLFLGWIGSTGRSAGRR